VKTAIPLIVAAAVSIVETWNKSVRLVIEAVPDDDTYPPAAKYPLEAKPPDVPKRIERFSAASKDTPVHITRISFVPDGIPVKSIEVPLVLDCGVACVRVAPASVALAVPMLTEPMVIASMLLVPEGGAVLNVRVVPLTL